jgi:hypothetical protein
MRANAERYYLVLNSHMRIDLWIELSKGFAL